MFIIRAHHVAAFALLLIALQSSAQTRMTAISTRGLVQTGDNVLIAGFIVQGTSPITVVVRGRGPSTGLAGALTDPTLTVVPAAGGANFVNDNWQLDLNASQLAASGYAPSNPLEAALLMTLNPGAYTAIVAGNKGATGLAIVEVYELPPPTNQTLSAKLIGGTWTFGYYISTTFFSQNYTFTSVDSSPGSSGAYVAHGTNQFGGAVTGAYFPADHDYAILEPGSIIDRFYVFTFSDNNHVSGCYYQINPPGSTNFSQCFSMAGLRNPPQAMQAYSTSTEAEELAATAAYGSTGYIQPGAVERYLELRKGP